MVQAQRFRQYFPTKALFLLLLIGTLDLIATAVLYSRGLIVELNPLMKPVIEASVWLFVLLKGMTLALAYFCMIRFAKSHLEFIQKSCIVGSGLYIFIWTVWFIAGSRA